MTILYLLAAVAALIAYALTARFGISTRLLIAAAVFAIPAISVTVWVVVVGDKAAPGSVTVYPNGNPIESNEKKP